MCDDGENNLVLHNLLTSHVLIGSKEKLSFPQKHIFVQKQYPCSDAALTALLLYHHQTRLYLTL